MTNSTLNVVSLDRPGIRADLVDFLRGNPLLLDYDFAGSDISLLVDLLAYDGNRQAFLTNMLFSEAFLDSCQLLSSGASHAKELGYCPRSARSSVANVTVTFQATGESQPYVIRKGSTLSTLVKNTQYVYSIPEALVVASANTSFSFQTPIYEGEYVKDAYVFRTTPDQNTPAFRITNPNVDTTSLTVVAFGDDQVVGTTYTLATSLLDLDDTSRVYFLQCTNDGYYEVLFGDGVLGAQPPQGARVVLDYRVCVGSPASDSAQRFVLNFDPTGSARESSQLVVTSSGPSTGGGPRESLESIKFYAPRWYQTQERAVTDPDYSTLLRTQFPELRAVTAYGGQKVKLYGRVVISAWIPGFTTLPDSRRRAYEQFLRGRMTTSVEVHWLDPLFTFVEVVSAVDFDAGVTANTPQRIESLVARAVSDWNQTKLGDFAARLLYSPFCRAIDGADPSILSNETTLRLYKRVAPQLGQANPLSLDFQIPLVSDLPPTRYPRATSQETVVTSDPFVWTDLTVRLEDDGAGNLCMVQDSAGKTTLVALVGTVDYSTGLVTGSVRFDGFQGQGVRVFARAAELDLSSSLNTILSIEPSGVIVRANPVNQ